MKETNIIKKNGSRWNKLPAGKLRLNILFLTKFPDFLLKIFYNYFARKWKRERGWEHNRYKSLFEGKDVLEIGSGLGYDSLVYSTTCKSYTHAELNNNQLGFLNRIHQLYQTQISIYFELLEDPFKHTFSRSFDAFYAHGVLHHIPFEEAKMQFQNIDKFLKTGSAVVFLMYPKERWVLAGSPSFEKFGDYTDGGCPWTEYYDTEKIKALVGDNYELTFEYKWGYNCTEFVNFEFIKKG